MSQIKTTSPPQTPARRVYLAVTLTLLAIAAWLKGEHVTDDRGSESTEKALVIIGSITACGLVMGAFIAYITGHINF